MTVGRQLVLIVSSVDDLTILGPHQIVDLMQGDLGNWQGIPVIDAGEKTPKTPANAGLVLAKGDGSGSLDEKATTETEY